VKDKPEWQESGREPMSRKQQRLLNAACGDLADQLRWHGIVFSKDDFRHFLSAIALGERLVPGYNDGMGPPGLIRMARSSTELNKTQATQVINMAFDIGDNPSDQGIQARPVRWCEVVTKVRFISDEVAP